MSITWRLLIALLLIGALLSAGRLALPWVQAKRADAQLNTANSHISEANRLMAAADLASLDSSAFSSEAAIVGTRPRLEAARSNLELALAELDAAISATADASRLDWLAEDYRLYLQKKEEIAILRKKQAEKLIETTQHLQSLYGSGEAFLAAMQEADRLKGRLLGAMEQVQGQPESAGQALAEVENSAAQLSTQLDEEYGRSGFKLLADLSAAIQQYGELAALGRELAAAAAAGDQETAQQLAAELEQKRYALSSGTGQLSAWWDAQITPLMDEFSTLQEEMERLDAEAAGMK